MIKWFHVLYIQIYSKLQFYENARRPNLPKLSIITSTGTVIDISLRGL